MIPDGHRLVDCLLSITGTEFSCMDDGMIMYFSNRLIIYVEKQNLVCSYWSFTFQKIQNNKNEGIQLRYPNITNAKLLNKSESQFNIYTVNSLLHSVILNHLYTLTVSWKAPDIIL